MTTYYVNSGATGTNSGADWTNAFNANPGAFAAALAAATTNGDIIKVHSAHVEEIAGDTTYTVGADISIISVDKDNSDALDPMGVDAWIGHSTGTAKYVEITGAFNVFMYGITFRNAGSTATNDISLSKTDGSHYEYESCYIWLGNNAPDNIEINNRLDSQVFVRLKNCTLRFANSGSRLHSNGRIVLEGCSISSDGTAPASLLQFSTTDPSGGECTLIGCDLSHLGSGTLVADSTTTAATARFIQCKLGAAYTALAPAIATQTNLNRSSAEVYIFDCSTDGTSGLFGYFNAMGSVVSDTGIYFTAGAAAQSWKIVTTAYCSYYTPFETPWFGYYNSDVSTAISPYIEILHNINNWAATTAYVIGDRVINDTGKVYVCDTSGTSAGSGGPTGTGADITDDTARWDYLGTSTAYQDNEVWIDVLRKTTTGSTQSTLTTDRMTLLGTAADQAAGAGIGSWTGENATAWSGKCLVGSDTPDEVGHIQARIVVGEPSITVYVDPQIRT